MSIAEEYDVEYTPAAPLRRASSLAKEMAAEAAKATASGPKRAYEVPASHGDNHPPPSGGGGGGGGGIAAPPPVTAWAVPSPDSSVASMPHAHATASPAPSAASWGNGAAAGGMGGIAQGYPSGSGEPKGQYVDPTTVSGMPSAPSDGRSGGGWAAATKGWGPTDGKLGGELKYGEGRGGGEEKKVMMEDPNDPPPPYTAYDIPSPPKTRPTVPPATFDIPAAPG